MTKRGRQDGDSAPVDPDKPQQRPTYQELLDESLKETFPASDPIAPGAAARPEEPAPSEKDAKDWKLWPGSKVEAEQGEGDKRDE